MIQATARSQGEMLYISAKLTKAGATGTFVAVGQIGRSGTFSGSV
jgi:hypothetical protein